MLENPFPHVLQYNAVITSPSGRLITVLQLQILMEQKSSVQLKQEKDP